MGRDPAAFVEEFDGRGGEAGLNLLVDELVRDAIGVTRDLDVIVNVHATGLPLGHDVARGGERAERRAVDPLVERAAADAQPLQRAVVEVVEQRPDGRVQRRETEEGLVPQPGEDPPLGHQDHRLDLRLVPGFRGARRDHDGAIVRREILVGAIDAGLIPAGAA